MTRCMFARPSFAVSCLMALGLAAASQAAGAASVAEIALMQGPDRQAKLEAGAKVEGEVNFYTTLIVDQAVIPIKNAWEKKYPAIKFNFVRASGAPLVQRIIAEARAGKPNADVAVPATDALSRADMLQKIWSPELAAFPAHYLANGGTTMTYRLSFFGMGYNTKLVSPADAPKAWEDILNPKWKGKMIWATSRETGGTFLIHHLLSHWGKAKADAFFDKLAAQNVAKSDASVRALLDLVIAGEYAMLITTSLNHAIISQGEKAPVDYASPDPVPARPDDIMLLNNAPHPHAGMLLIDFILSREGQEVLSKAEYQVARTDVDPLPSMRPIIPELNGKKSIVYRPETLTAVEPQLREIFDKVSP